MSAPRLLLLVLLLGFNPQVLSSGLARFDLSGETSWRLSNSNSSIQLPVKLPAHVLGVLAAAGVVGDYLYRYGELEARWVAEEHWNFTLIWPGSRHAEVLRRRHVLLVAYGIDTFGQVVLNSRHLAATNNAHRSWWLLLPDPGKLLREGANLLSLLLRPAVAVALRDKATYPYDIPTMMVPGGFDVYNFARKPASDFGWDWGPAFAPAGITGRVELLGFDRATLIGALVHQQEVNSSTFSLTVTAQLLVPEAGDSGLLTVELPALALSCSKQEHLQSGVVGGNPLQALSQLQLHVPAAAVRLWQPRGLLPPGQTNLPALYDVTVSFTPSNTSCCTRVGSDAGGGSRDGEVRSGSRGSSSGSSDGPCQQCGGDDVSSITRRVGFRTIELVRQPIKAAETELNSGITQLSQQQPRQVSRELRQQRQQQAGSGSSSSAAGAAALEPGSWAEVQGFYSLVGGEADKQQSQALPGSWPRPVSSQAAAVGAAVEALCLGANVTAISAEASSASATGSSGDAGSSDDAGSSNTVKLQKTGVPEAAANAGAEDSDERQQLAAEHQRQKQLQELKQACSAQGAAAVARFCRQRPQLGTQQQQQQQQRQQQRQHQQQDTTSPPPAAVTEEDGESFYFRVNGVPVYAKGANLIPLHVLSSAVEPADVKLLLQAAADANMNMIRIWGGGLYQIDALYDAADELGLLVWQEAMFACSPYPRDASFLSNVAAEVTQEVLRLGSHPSIAVWGGNNEVEAALDWYPQTLSNARLFAVDYNELFVETIGSLLQQFLPGAPWVDSSPSNGYISVRNRFAADDQQQQQQSQNAGAAADAAPADAPETDPGTGQPAAAGGGRAATSSIKRWGNPQNPRSGDVHFYNYRDDCQDWRTYPAARFVSEYGWQSYPSWATYAAATAAQDWQLAAPMTEFRQRHPNGTVELLVQLQRRFKLPDQWISLLQQQLRQQVAAPGASTAADTAAAATSDDTQHQQPSGWLDMLTSVVTAAVQGMWQQQQGVLQQHIRLLSDMLSHVQQGLAKVVTLARPTGSRATDTAGASAAALQPAGSPGQQQQQQQQTEASGRSSSSSSSAAGTMAASGAQAARAAPVAAAVAASAAAGAELRHWIYLTQLQQLLCYDTALSYWRRLRSTSGVYTMGVLYWQLNDLWAGASWSSVDYGVVWKPLHYGVARAFGDLSMSVQHDLHNETIQVFVVSDLLQPVEARLTIRLLSLTDSPDTCSGSDATDRTSSSSNWHRFEQQVDVAVPTGAAVLGWAGTVEHLLAAAGSSCSRSSCYVHVSMRAAAAAAAENAPGRGSSQEATVWLAPFSKLQLPKPRIRFSDFRFVPTEADDASPAEGAAASSHSSMSGGSEVQFTVRSDAVAVFAVWELQANQPALAGRFSDNALTLHPCQPRRIAFVPRSGDAASRGQQEDPGSTASDRSDGDGAGSGMKLVRFLQQQLVVSSLYDHQQFASSPSSGRNDAAPAAGGSGGLQRQQPVVNPRVIEE